MIRRPPRSTRTDTLVPYRRSSDLATPRWSDKGPACVRGCACPAALVPVRVLPPGRARPGRDPACRAEGAAHAVPDIRLRPRHRSEEHTSELQSLMRTSYAVFCLKKNNMTTTTHRPHHTPSD